MEPYGGFDHNVQTFRVVTELEQRYPALRRAEPDLGDARGGDQAQRPGRPTSWTSRPGRPIADYDRRATTCGSAPSPRPRPRSRPSPTTSPTTTTTSTTGCRPGCSRLDGPGGRAADRAGPGRGARRTVPTSTTGMLRLEAVRRMIGAMVDDVLAETQRAARRRRSVALARGRAHARTAPLVAFSPRHGWRTWRGCAPSCSSGCTATTGSTAPAARRGASWREMFQLFMAEPDVLPTEWFDAGRRTATRPDGPAWSATTSPA